MNPYTKPTANITKIATESLLNNASQLSVGGTTDQNLGKGQSLDGDLWED